MTSPYVHGYRAREGERLHDQASALTELLHGDTFYPAGDVVLEVGCAVGAQTIALTTSSPAARFVAIDMAAGSVAAARASAARLGRRNASFAVADIFTLPFAPASFDHVFVCFVLEHLSAPLAALSLLRRIIRPGGTITVIEGDHGSACFHPDSSAARAAIQCQIDLQRAAGGDALIGRQLFPLLAGAGFDGVKVSPRLVYVDGSRPALADAFTIKTFTAMIEGTRDVAVAAGLATADAFDAGVRDLYRAAWPDGVFCYTFFKATAVAAQAREPQT
jgi:predicted O-methyltransferase YrrM